jgi:hypothetical protein
VIATVGEVPFATVTDTAADVMAAPAESFATAVKTCGPLTIFVLSTEIANGPAPACKAPKLAPSSWNCKLAIVCPDTADALAVNATVAPEIDAPPAGAVIAADAGFATVTATVNAAIV